MARISKHTNQGATSQGEPCAFPRFGNGVHPFIATLSLPIFTIGLLVWFSFIPIVLNAPDSCQEHQTIVDSFLSSPSKSSLPSSSSSGESVYATSQGSNKNKRNIKKK